MIPKIHHFETLSSTMDKARELACEGAAEGTMVQADVQTAGRGRRGNQWTSPKGNLLVTFILRPQKPIDDIAQLSFVAALALADAINRDDVTLKWPNDILAGGKKLAGILLEMQSGKGPYPDFLLIGIGLNIAYAPEGCAAIGGDVNAMRDAVFETLDHWYGIWQRQGFAQIRNAWLARAHGLNAPITARLREGNIQGVFEGIDEAGHLILRQSCGSRLIINGGDVHFAA